MSVIAGIYFDQDKLKKSFDLKMKIYEIWNDALGRDHPQTVSIVNDLAVVLEYVGKSAVSHELFE